MTDFPDGVYDRLEAVLQPVHDQLVERLAPTDGDCWLDLASGSGEVTLRAARAGARVVGIEPTEPLVDRLRGDAETAGLDVRFDVGDVEYLPYDDESYDVLVSSFGFVTAADHVNVASELARVARPGARLGFTAWKPNPKLGELYRQFTDEPLDGRESTEWGREDHVEDMLGDDFELEFEDGTLTIDAASGEEIWELFSVSAPTVRGLLDKLGPDDAKRFHAAFVELYETYRKGDRVLAPRRYLFTLGTRR